MGSNQDSKLMKQIVFVSALWSALASIVYPPATCYAEGGNSAVAQVVGSNRVSSLERGSSPAILEQWSGCSTEQALTRLPRLCPASPNRISVDAFRVIRDALRSGGHNIETLCAADMMLVSSQYECSASQAGGVGLLAELMRLAAWNWKQSGALERADQLFEQSYSLGDKEHGTLRKIVVLQDWAILKLEKGEQELAMELTDLQVNLARKEYQSATSADFASSLLVDALMFQAEVQEKVGLIERAQETRKEAGEVAAVPRTCRGICGEVIERID